MNEYSWVSSFMEKFFHMLGGFEKVGTVFLHIEAVIDCAGHSGADSSIFE